MCLQHWFSAHKLFLGIIFLFFRFFWNKNEFQRLICWKIINLIFARNCVSDVRTFEKLQEFSILESAPFFPQKNQCYLFVSIARNPQIRLIEVNRHGNRDSFNRKRTPRDEMITPRLKSLRTLW